MEEKTEEKTIQEICQETFDGIIDSMLYKGNATKMFHYTSSEGLLNILRSGKLWFTNGEYLNDSSEGKYIFEVMEECKIDKYSATFQRYIKQIMLGQEAEDAVKEDAAKHLREFLIFNFKVFICSFSISGDSLPLWNYYTKNPSSVGYNIGFNTKEFIERIFSPETKILYLPVLYSKKKQVQLLQSLFDAAYELYNKVKGDDKRYLLFRLGREIELLKFAFKHSAFSEEKEVRLVWLMDQKEYKENLSKIAESEIIKMRVQNGFFTPYVELPFDREKILQITVSPTLKDEQAIDSLQLLVDKYQLKECEISKSSIPLKF